MPVMPSTTYHKYDTTDYENIDPQYGTLDDFQKLLTACHDRGIRVILDLAMNHSSSRHSWFLQATEYLKNLPEGAQPDPSECPYVDYYHFSREAQSGYAQVNGADSVSYTHLDVYKRQRPDMYTEDQKMWSDYDDRNGYYLSGGKFVLEKCDCQTPALRSRQQLSLIHI